MRITALGRTDVGKVRERNEDQALVLGNLFAVADGVGGHKRGDIASSLVMNALSGLDGQEFTGPDQAQEALFEAIRSANATIRAQSEEHSDRRGMASTVTVAMLVGEQMVFAQVGDTRAYLKRDGRPLHRLTPDHSFVGALIEAGAITEEQARTHPKRSVILRAVGLEDVVEPEAGVVLDLYPGDEILLMSDGVHGVVEDPAIAELTEQRALPDAVQAIIGAACDAGGPDNITVVVLRVEADDAEHTTGAAPA